MNETDYSSPKPKVEKTTLFQQGVNFEWLHPKGSGETVPLTGAALNAAYTAAIQAVRDAILPWDALIAEQGELTAESERIREQQAKLKTGWRLRDSKSESSLATLDIRQGCVKTRTEGIEVELEEHKPALAEVCSTASRMIGALMDPLRESALAQQRAGLLVDYIEAAANEIFGCYWMASHAGIILGRVGQGGLINNLKSGFGPGEPRAWADGILAADAALTKFVVENAHLLKAVEHTAANAVPATLAEKFTP